jgi:hypothetical protein
MPQLRGKHCSKMEGLEWQEDDDNSNDGARDLKPWSLEALDRLDTNQVDLPGYAVRYRQYLTFPSLVRQVNLLLFPRATQLSQL